MGMIKNIRNRLLLLAAFFLPMGKTLRPRIHKMRGMKIGKNVWISKLVYLDELHPEDISIGDNSTIGFRTSIYTHLYFGPRQKKSSGKVIIGKNVYIGPHCLILPNVKIGDNAVIKGGTVVTRNVPANMLWGLPNAGPIAEVTTPLTSEHSYDEFVKGLRPLRTKRNWSENTGSVNHN